MQKEKQKKQKHYTCKYFWKPSESKLDPEEQTQQSNHAGKEVLPKEYCITWVNWLQRAWTFFWDGLCRNEWMSETELADTPIPHKLDCIEWQLAVLFINYARLVATFILCLFYSTFILGWSCFSLRKSDMGNDPFFLQVKSFTDVMLKFKATKCFHILDAWKQEYLYTSSTYLVFTKCSLNAASYFSRDENTKSATVFYHCPFRSFIFLWNQPKSINMTRAVNVSVRKRLAHLFCTFSPTISKRQPILKDSCTWTLKNDPQQSCSS